MKANKLVLFFLAAFSVATSAFAGAGYIITESGVPSKWDASVSLKVHPESGVCGTFSNAQMLSKLATNLGYWDDLSEVNVDFDVISGSITGVDGCNYGDYLVGVTGGSDAAASDSLNPVLFDNDGEIVAAVAGTSNKFRVLGFANPAGFTSDYSQIVDGQAVFNCRCLAGNEFGDCTVGQATVVFSEDDLNFTMTHELGHFQNLDHTQINSDLVSDGDDANDEYIPTMYPISENAAAQISPIQDDISALGGIYPSSTFVSGQCLVTGSLRFSGGQQMRCADVQAINAADRSKSVAFISGAYAPAVDNNGDGDTADSGECTANCGDFQLYLDPGISYTVSVTAVNSEFTGGSGLSPCANGQLTNVTTETLATVSATECVAGATVALGTITTTSTYSSSQTGGVAASLSAALTIDPELLHDEDGFGFALEDITDVTPPYLIGGPDVRPARATASCPESSGSSSSSSGGSSTTSSTSSGSSSGCSLAAVGDVEASWRVVGMGSLLLCVLVLALRRRVASARI